MEGAAGHQDVAQTNLDDIGNNRGTARNIHHGGGSGCFKVHGKEAGVQRAVADRQRAVVIHGDAPGGKDSTSKKVVRGDPTETGELDSLHDKIGNDRVLSVVLRELAAAEGNGGVHVHNSVGE